MQGQNWLEKRSNHESTDRSYRDLRIVFDNFDFRIMSNVTLPDHKNADMHWIAQFATFDR